MKRTLIKFLTIFSLALPLASSPVLADEIVGQASVIDGDTIEIRGERIRLEGIDAPESNQWCLDANEEGYPCGRIASFALADLVGRQHVRCDIVGLDQYTRMLGVCHLADIELNEWMVGQGHALAYRRYSTAYVGAEKAAQSAGVGMWQGRFDAPWDFRNGEPTIGQGGKLVKLASDRDCPIKGNISRSGEKIYHSPGQQHYGRTRIDESAGERWFCSAAEAEAAGWRAAKR